MEWFIWYTAKQKVVILRGAAANDVNQWAIEESRIRGGYNNTSTDYGAKAYLVEEEPNGYNKR